MIDQMHNIVCKYESMLRICMADKDLTDEYLYEPLKNLFIVAEKSNIKFKIIDLDALRNDNLCISHCFSILKRAVELYHYDFFDIINNAIIDINDIFIDDLKIITKSYDYLHYTKLMRENFIKMLCLEENGESLWHMFCANIIANELQPKFNTFKDHDILPIIKETTSLIDPLCKLCISYL